MEIINFKPDVRSIGAVKRHEIELSNGHVMVFSDVYDYDTDPFIGLDLYYPMHVPIDYMCVIDGASLARIEWNRDTNEVIVVGTNNKKVSIQTPEIKIISLN